MKRPLALVATIALAALAALAPVSAATAATPPTADKAVWVNGTLRVVYSWQDPRTPADDTWMYVQVDGKIVDSPTTTAFTDRVFETTRAASAGPALVEVVSDACIDGTEGDTCTPTTVYRATVSQHVVKAKKGQVSAATLLAELKVAKESHASTYKRSKFKLWVDANKDGENTRAEVLKSESTKKVTENRSHTVKTGRWTSPYDGKKFTVASKLDIDHLVPLEEAWTSGAYSWSTKKRTAYANDIGYAPSLIAVSQHENRSKGDQEPNEWLPAKTSYTCSYVRNYIAVKYRWGLKVDPTEKTALKYDLAEYCVNPNVTKPGKPNLTALVGKPKTSGSNGGSGGGSGTGETHAVDTRYSTCTELLRHPNHAPYKQGRDVEYNWYQDRDHDGWDCE